MYLRGVGMVLLVVIYWEKCHVVGVWRYDGGGWVVD
jgi:hypothetical protein